MFSERKRNKDRLDIFSNRKINSPEWWDNIRMNPTDKFKIFSRTIKDGLYTPHNTPRSQSPVNESKDNKNVKLSQ
jgi:hypothetical protein